MHNLQSYSSWFEEQNEGIYDSISAEETDGYLGNSTQEGSAMLSSSKKKLLTSNQVEDIMSMADLSLEENGFKNTSVQLLNALDEDFYKNQRILSDSMEIETMPKKSQQLFASVEAIKKAPYNFGQRAIGNFMRNLIKDKHYDEYIARKFNKGKFYIREFRNFCREVSYLGIKEFREIWKCTKLIGEQENDFYVILRKITKKFLKCDVSKWLKKTTIHKEIIPYYEKCIKLYLEGIRNPDDFSFTEYDIKF